MMFMIFMRRKRFSGDKQTANGLMSNQHALQHLEENLITCSVLEHHDNCHDSPHGIIAELIMDCLKHIEQ